MSYSKYYNPTNWENYPSEDTAINAARLNNIEDGVDTLDDRIVELSTDKSEVEWNQTLIAGKKIAEITINGIKKDVIAPEGGSGGGGGSEVTITPILQSGTKIANYTIDGVGGSLYAPNGGGGSSSFADLTDVDLNNLQNGQVPKWNSTTQKWENANESGGGGASTLNELSDVDITTPTSGQVLLYDDVNDEWINGTVPSGSSTLDGLTDVTITTPSNNQVLKYDSANNKWINANESGSGGGSTIKVTTTDSSLFGEILTLSDGVTTLTTAFSNSGEAIFSGVTMTGNLTLTCEGDSMVVSVPYFGNYDFVFSAFAATITVSYPTGATCTCVGGGESQTATSNPQVFTVHSANTYRVTATVDGVPKYQDVVITTDGQSETVSIAFGTINVALDADFIGETITCVNGGTTISKTASTTSLVFYPPTTGTWTISSTVSGTTYSVDAVVSSLSTAVSVSLQTMPSVTVTIYSATEDTVLFTDESGAKTEVFASGQSSKAINITIPQGGMSITFTSSVAKEPSDYSQYYSKTVTVDENTTEVYLRPQNALYWFGYMSDDCEKLAVSNGWGINSGYSYDEPSFNTNSVYCNARSGKIIGLGKKTTVAASKAFVVYTHESGGSAGILCTHSTKTTNGQSAYVEPSTTAHYAELNLSNHQNEYLTYSFNNQRSGYIEAFWY